VLPAGVPDRAAEEPPRGLPGTGPEPPLGAPNCEGHVQTRHLAAGELQSWLGVVPSHREVLHVTLDVVLPNCCTIAAGSVTVSA
jgi:hypothetical protein